MVDTLPLALISIRATHAISSMGFFREITDTMLTDLLEHRTLWAIVEITGYKYPSIDNLFLYRIKRLTQAVGYSFTERAAMTFTTITAGEMNHKNMQHITR